MRIPETARRIGFQRATLFLLVVPAFLLFLTGCSLDRSPLFDAAGPSTLATVMLLVRVTLIMLIVVLPVFVLTAIFTLRYRASRGKGRYQEDWSSTLIDGVVWAIPALIIVTLATAVWDWTHRLDPYRALEGTGGAALEIEVVAQDWKWLFLYPEEGIASVNELALPVGRPIRFKITSDTVMNSFAVPALGGQIYAMAGMQTQLNLLADRPGRFTGRNLQYSGKGFSDQYFDVLAMSESDFTDWIARARSAAGALDAATYASLSRPSIRHPVTLYHAVAPGLFDAIIARYTGHHAAMN